MNMIIRIILGAVGVVLILFGVLLLMAAPYEFTINEVQYATTNLILGLVFVGIAFGLFIISYKGKDKTEVTIIQKVDLAGDTTTKKLVCDNCGGVLDRKTLKVQGGVITIVCPYCETVNEFEEEPKW